DVHVAADPSALIELDAPRADLALHDARRLELESAFCDDLADDASTDHCVLRRDVAEDDAILPHHDGLPGLDRPFDGPFDAKGALGDAVAGHPHSGSNDRNDAIAPVL